MATLPTPIRAVLGLAATAIDEARRLPETLPQLPVAAISTAMQTSLRVQQHIAEYAARGDELLTALRGSSEEPPAWATFDDDAESAAGADGATKAAFDLIEEADAISEEDPADLIAPAGSSSNPADSDAEATGSARSAASAVAAPAKKAPAKKVGAKKAPATKAAAQVPAKKAPAAPTPAVSAPAKKAAAKQAPAKKAAAKKAPAKTTTRSEPLEVAAERADPSGPPNPSVLAAEIVQAHQAESE